LLADRFKRGCSHNRHGDVRLLADTAYISAPRVIAVKKPLDLF
jgi:hypothetical protein